jgi:serine/threonine protein kinase
VVDETARAKHDNSPPKQQQPAKAAMAPRASEPVFSTSQGQATYHAEQAADVKKQNKRIPDENIAKLVAEENESKSKFPHYPGLERWELVEKMGDGAFSNVYRARDREGTAGEVAIKVVRKFEMSSMQVRDAHGDPRVFWPARLSCFFRLPFALFPFFSKGPFTNSRAVLEQQTPSSRL